MLEHMMLAATRQRLPRRRRAPGADPVLGRDRIGIEGDDPADQAGHDPEVHRPAQEPPLQFGVSRMSLLKFRPRNRGALAIVDAAGAGESESH